MTKRYLNALAADLRRDRRTLVTASSLAAFDLAVDTVITGLIRSNPRVDRERFMAAVLAP